MPKLIAHVVVALLVWAGLSWVGAPVALRVAAVVLGAVGVHVVFERYFADPFLYLGAMPVDADDPLMVQARERARATWPRFVELWPEHRQDSCVRFAFTTDAGEVEQLWGDALELSEESVEVYLRTPPATQTAPLESPRMTIPLESVTDWQVELRDGTLRGGFTNRAMFRIFERAEGHLPRQLREQLERFRDEDVEPS